MGSSWSILALKRQIERGSGDTRELVRILDSVGRYVDIFEYHKGLARDAMKVVVQDNPHGMENLRFVLGGSERQHEYKRAKIASEANILASIHAARALVDVFAFLVNALVLGSRIPATRCDIRSVSAVLPNSPMAARLNQLLNSHWFNYVSAFVNTAKHRHLVPHGFWVELELGAAGIRLEGFEYNDVSYPAYSVEDLLHGVIEVRNSVVDCGKLLNQEVLGDTA